MFESLSRQAIELGLPLIPVFQASGLPCVTDKIIQRAFDPLIQASMRTEHPTKNACISLDTLGDNGCRLYVVEVFDSRINRLLQPTAALGHKLIYKTMDPTGRKDFDVYNLEGDIVVSVQLRGYVTVLSATDLPSKHAEIIVVDLQQLREILDEVGEIRTQNDPYTRLPSTFAQLDYQLKSKNGLFVANLLLKSNENTRVLPILHEIDAVYAQMTVKLLKDARLAHSPVGLYIQHFLSLLSEQIHENKLKLHPDALRGIGAQYSEKYFVSLSKDDIQMDYEDFKTFALRLMSASIGSEQKMLVACQDIFDEMALSTALSKIQLDQFKRFVSRQSAMKLNMNKIESQILETRKERFGLGSFSNTLGKAISTLNLMGDFRYDGIISSELLRWSGAFWEIYPDVELRQFINYYFASKEIQRSISKLNEMCESIKRQFASYLPPTSGVNFLNCYLDENLNTFSHDRRQGFTYAFDFEYNPELPDPALFLDFLNDCFCEQTPADRDRNINLVKQTIAATLFQKGPSLQKAVLLYGAASTGKSQLLEIVKRLVPSHKTCAISPEKWNEAVQAKGLNDKLLNVCGELSETKSIDAQRFKDIVDGNPITHSTLSTSFTVTPHCTHWFASNHLPKSKDPTEGFSRRWLIIQFDNVVKPHLRVLDLGSKIASAEKEQIVNWASKAITQLNEQRSFDLAPNDLEGGIARMNNNVRYFIETACTTHNLSWLKSLEKDELTQELTALKPTSLKYIYTKYSVFVKDMNCGAVVDEQEFIMRMRHLAAMFGFISVVGAAANRRIIVQYYGVNL
jgi:hypothetical protein